MQKAIGFLAMLVIGLCLSGCSTVSTYTIKVNGYTDPGAPGPVKPGGSFCVIENQETKNPLLEKEIKEKITKLLERVAIPSPPLRRPIITCFLPTAWESRAASARPRRIIMAVSVGEEDMAGAVGAAGAAPSVVRRDALWGLPGRQRHPLRPLAPDQGGGGARLPDSEDIAPRMGGGSPERGRLLGPPAWCSIICWWRILRSSARIPAKP